MSGAKGSSSICKIRHPVQYRAGMNITLNGEPLSCEADTTLTGLIARLEIRGRYAVEVNGEIIPRSEHESYALAEGDVVEVVEAVGGG